MQRPVESEKTGHQKRDCERVENSEWQDFKHGVPFS
jgi:hypothetical protein